MPDIFNFAEIITSKILAKRQPAGVDPTFAFMCKKHAILAYTHAARKLWEVQVFKSNEAVSQFDVAF